MAHRVLGLVARFAQLAKVARPPLVVAPLAQGFGFAVEAGLSLSLEDEPGVPPAHMMALGATWGETFPVALIATDYDGGYGAQAAAAWSSIGERPFTIEDCSINESLSLIGIVTVGAHDEFDAAGLGWYRSNDDWIEYAKHGRAGWQQETWPAAAEAWKQNAGTLE